MADVDPALLALSDLLVLTALERAYARTARRARYTCPPAERHNQYLRHAIPEAQVEAVLRDAWALCPTLAIRHNLDVDPTDWHALLDGYTRALIMMSQNHNPTRLIGALARLHPAPDDWDGPDG